MEAVDRLSDDGLAIFLFHGVVHQARYPVRNYTGKHMERDRFYRAIERLAQEGCALSMDDVVKHCHKSLPFPGRSFAVAFDDGFENNISVAAPILREFKVPATFYLTTGFIEHNAMSWIDRIEYCLERASCGSLQLPWEDRPRSLANPVEKIDVLQNIRTRVKSDRAINPDELAELMFEQCGLSLVRSSDEPIDRKMNWEQAARLGGDELFTIGGHSHRHVILSFLEPRELKDEITTSIELIHRRTGVRVRHYSYPEGLEHCYSDEVIRVLRANGVVCCPAAVDGINDHRSDLFRLRRIMIT